MNLTLDHLVYAAPDLETARRDFAQRTGVETIIGGRHPLWGTQNALTGLGGETYFEILSPAPDLPPTPRSERIAALPEPQLITWAVRTTNAAALAQTVRQLGYEAEHFDMNRRTPTDELLQWQIVRLESPPSGRLFPFFIDWLDTPHPASRLPHQMTLRHFALEAIHPQPLRALLAQLGLEVAVQEATADRLVAQLETPQGDIQL